MKNMASKKPAKDQRERLVLMGLVELYLESDKPIGSNTLRENGFDHLSSATIRNYFAKLENDGFLRQHHSSGGRVPTEEAFKLYVDSHLKKPAAKEKELEGLRAALSKETREVSAYLQEAAETLSEVTNCAVFLSSPRFDHDFIFDIKLVPIDHQRCLCVLITDFGMVRTEILYAEGGLSDINLSKVRAYLEWRIKGEEAPKLNEAEEKCGLNFYREIMLRHIVTTSNFSSEDLTKTGFSKLLNYPDFNNAATLASGLSLFENHEDMQKLLRGCCADKELQCLLGDDLSDLATPLAGCSLILIPYQIHQTVAGAIAILGPLRLPYRALFALMQTASEAISQALTRSLHKFQITFRRPTTSHIELESQSPGFAQQARGLLIEQKDQI
ncbi:MAG: Heat-inducible transcription repressor HrcA [Chlamydiae bacterium]|nr:Heat-inducible transcription repressor HrcA [Chlamydiota bacterium]